VQVEALPAGRGLNRVGRDTPAVPEAPRRDLRFAGFQVVLAMAAVMWLSEIVDSVADHRLDGYGIEPRDDDGLIGVAAAPFLHAGFGHLISNTVPFLLMGFVIAAQGAARVVAVTVIVGLISGLGTWLIAPEHTIHIGASGIVFGYASYLISRGFFNRNVLELAVGAIVAVVYGSALLGGLVPEDGVSWQGHFFGAVGGVVAARGLATKSSAEER
jgi:membrane associated rhomboid family serine protease